MVHLVSERSDQPWRRRLYLPTYQVKEAARYAHVSSQTVSAWHRDDGYLSLVLSNKSSGDALSYLQLIEVAVVAAFRQMGVSLRRLREAREYISGEMKTEYPFAAYKFKTDGKKLLLDYQQVIGKKGRGKLLEIDPKGQLAWDEIVGTRLEEFDYARSDIAKRWFVAGIRSKIVIDPQIAFGSPTIMGVPTWVIKERWVAGESVEDIRDDFRLKPGDVMDALRFEGVQPDLSRQRKWTH